MADSTEVVPHAGQKLDFLAASVQQEMEMLMMGIVQSASDMAGLLRVTARSLGKEKVGDKKKVAEWIADMEATLAALNRDQILLDDKSAIKVAGRAAAATNDFYEHLTTLIDELDRRRKQAAHKAITGRMLKKLNATRAESLARCQSTVQENCRLAEAWFKENAQSVALLRTFATTSSCVEKLVTVGNTVTQVLELQKQGETSPNDLRQYLALAEKEWNVADALQAQMHELLLRLRTAEAAENETSSRIVKLGQFEQSTTEMLWYFQGALAHLMQDLQYKRA